MELKLKAKHFEGTEYHSRCNCAIAKAAKEKFNTTAVVEMIDSIIIDRNEYQHVLYETEDFLEDQKKAESAYFSDEVIRTIRLKKIN